MKRAEVHWYDDEQTIVLQAFHNGVGWKAVVEAALLAGNMVRSVNHPVYSLVDCSALIHVPHGNIMEVKRLVGAEIPPNNHGTFLAGIQSRIIRQAYRTLVNAYGGYHKTAKVFMADTVPGALTMIETEKARNGSIDV